MSAQDVIRLSATAVREGGYCRVVVHKGLTKDIFEFSVAKVINVDLHLYTEWGSCKRTMDPITQASVFNQKK